MWPIFTTKLSSGLPFSFTNKVLENQTDILQNSPVFSCLSESQLISRIIFNQ